MMAKQMNQNSFLSCGNYALEACKQAIREGKRPVILANSYRESLSIKRFLADKSAGFAVTVDTLSNWVEDLWSIFGDGTSTVNSLTRSTIIETLLSNPTSNELPRTSGITNLLVNTARVALPYACKAFEAHGATTASAAPFAESEIAALRIMYAYSEVLSNRGRSESCEQMFTLSGMTSVLQQYQVIAFDLNEQSFSRIQKDFLDACNAIMIHNECLAENSTGDATSDTNSEDRANDVNSALAPELRALRNLLFRRTHDDAPIQPTGSVRFALPSGPTATYAQIAELIFDAADSNTAESGRTASDGTKTDHTTPEGAGIDHPTPNHSIPDHTIAVVASDPIDMASKLGDALNARGISFAAKGFVPTVATVMGSAIYNLLQMTDAAASAAQDTSLSGPLTDLAFNHLDVLQAADFERNPFSGASTPEAFRTEKMERGNRLITCEEVLCDITQNAGDLNGVTSNFENNEYTVACRVLKRYVDQHFSKLPVFHKVQSTVLEQCSELFDLASKLDLAKSDIEKIMETLSVQVSISSTQVSADKKPNTHVVFCTISSLAQEHEASVDTVIFAQMDASFYPLRPAEDALHTLLDKLDCAQDNAAPLITARHTFAKALATARRQVILQHTLYNADGDACIPSAMYAEVIDCYRDALENDDDFDDVTQLPEKLLPYARQRGEEHIVENALFGREVPPSTSVDLPPTGTLAPENNHLIVLPRNQNSDPNVMDLSASQIESYLECPYKWFAQRRMSLQTLDEGFGPLQRGSFMHVIMQTFYETMHENGMLRVTHENLDAARQVMTDVFSELSDYQFQMHGNSNRYVPITSWERAERDQMLPKLLDWLSTEAQMLPGYHPAYFEWEFGRPVPFDYAGVHIVGSVDRIDVDDHGHAIVIDYKSALNNGFRLHNPKKKDTEGKQKKANQKAEGTPDGGGAHDSTPNDAPKFTLPQKMQALIYARVVQDKLQVDGRGVKVVGALYLNPLKTSGTGALQGQAQGAFDARYVDSQTLPFASKSDLNAGEVPYEWAANFDELIQRSEDAVADRLKELAKGDIKPDPLQPANDICKYCPVISCPKRVDA